MDTAESSHPFGVINSTFSSGAAQSRDTGHIDRKRRALFTGAVKRAIHRTHYGVRPNRIPADPAVQAADGTKPW